MKATKGRVVVEVLDVDAKSAGGIHLPDSHKDKNQGIVLSVGSDCEGLSEQDKVIFNQHAGTEIKDRDKVLKVLDYKDVLIVL